MIGEDIDSISPVINVTLDDPAVDGNTDLLCDIVNMLREQSILVTLAEGTPLDWKPWGPFIQVVVTAAHAEAYLLEFVHGFESAVNTILKKHLGE